VEGHKGHAIGIQPIGHIAIGLFQRHCARVQRQAIKTGAVFCGKGAKTIQRLLFIKHRNIAFQRKRRIENPGAATGRFFGGHGMRGTVGSQKVFGRSPSRRLTQGQPVRLALGHGQAIGMRTQPPGEHGIAVDVQVLRGDRGSHAITAGINKGHRIGRGDMFKHHLQFRQIAQQRGQHPINKHRFAIKYIHRRIGYFAMDAQRHADLLHAFKHAADIANIGNPMRRSGGGMGGIELGCGKHAFAVAARNRIRIAGIGQITGHQRGEIGAGRQGGQDPIPIGRRFRHAGKGRRKVGHHQSAGKLPRGKGQDTGKNRAIAQVNVPIIRAADGQGLDGLGHATPMPQPRRGQQRKAKRTSQQIHRPPNTRTNCHSCQESPLRDQCLQPCFLTAR